MLTPESIGQLQQVARQVAQGDRSRLLLQLRQCLRNVAFRRRGAAQEMAEVTACLAYQDGVLAGIDEMARTLRAMNGLGVANGVETVRTS